MKLSECSIMKTDDLDKLKEDAKKYSEICNVLHYGTTDGDLMTDEEKLQAIRKINVERKRL